MNCDSSNLQPITRTLDDFGYLLRMVQGWGKDLARVPSSDQTAPRKLAGTCNAT